LQTDVLPCTVARFFGRAGRCRCAKRDIAVHRAAGCRWRLRPVGAIRRRAKFFFRRSRKVYKQSLYTKMIVVVNAGPFLWKRRLTAAKSWTY
jgi:hypothetical protein